MAQNNFLQNYLSAEINTYINSWEVWTDEWRPAELESSWTTSFPFVYEDKAFYYLM